MTALAERAAVRTALDRIFNEVLRHLPDTVGLAPRTGYLRRRAAGFGAGSIVHRGSRVLGVDRLRVGRGVTVARDVTLDARGGLELRDGALVGFESVLLTHTHNSGEVGARIQDQGMHSAPVVIGERAWLGMRTLVMPGVRIGADAIVGAGSVVTRDVRERAVVAGVPARELRLR